MAERLLTLHLLGLISGLLVLATIAIITRGKFIRLATLLVATNFVYIVNWKVRGQINFCAFAFGTVAIVFFLALVSLCVIGGAIVHRDRTRSYLAQYHESLLPSPWPATPVFAVQGMMRPAQDISGDFYDHFTAQDGAVCLVVADVCGKGIPAGLFGMSAKSVLRTTALQPAQRIERRIHPAQSDPRPVRPGSGASKHVGVRGSLISSVKPAALSASFPWYPRRCRTPDKEGPSGHRRV